MENMNTKAMFLDHSGFENLTSDKKEITETIVRADRAQYASACDTGMKILDAGVWGEGYEALWIWFLNGIMYFYSEAETVYLNPDSGYMFAGWRKLKDIGALKGVDTSLVTNMRSVFEGCRELSDISALEGWDMSSVTDLSSAFEDTAIEDTVSLGFWNTGNVKHMGSAFCNCHGLKSLDGVEHWDVSEVCDMSFMFYGDEKLSDVTGMDTWDTGNVNDMGYMFYGCGDIRSGKPVRLSADSLESALGIFDKCRKVPVTLVRSDGRTYFPNCA